MTTSIAGVHKFGTTDNRRRFLGDQIRILEQADTEYVFQQPNSGLLKALAHDRLAMLSQLKAVRCDYASYRLFCAY